MPKKENNAETEITVLLVTNDPVRADAYAKKLPEYAAAVYADTTEKSISEAFVRHRPDAIYILLQKGERIYNKNFDRIFSYIAGYSARFGVSGSKAQIDTVTELARAYDIEEVRKITVKDAEKDVSAAKKEQKRRRALMKEKAKEYNKHRSSVLIVCDDINAARKYIVALLDYSESIGINFGIHMCDAGVILPNYLRDNAIRPDLVIYTGAQSKAIIKAANTLCRSEEYSDIPFLVTADSGNVPESISRLARKPDYITDIEKDKFALSLIIDKTIKK